MASIKPIALLGEYNPNFQPHVATSEAIIHSRALLRSGIEGVWVNTEEIDDSLFQACSAIWVAPGSPYKNMHKTLWAIKTARRS